MYWSLSVKNTQNLVDATPSTDPLDFEVKNMMVPAPLCFSSRASVLYIVLVAGLKNTVDLAYLDDSMRQCREPHVTLLS